MSYEIEARRLLHIHQKQNEAARQAAAERNEILQQADKDGIAGIKARVDRVTESIKTLWETPRTVLASEMSRDYGWGDIVCELRPHAFTSEGEPEFDEPVNLAVIFAAHAPQTDIPLGETTFMRVPRLDSRSEHQFEDGAFTSFHDAPGEIQEYIVNCLVPAEQLAADLLARKPVATAVSS